jgi:predicted NBD/HSP70 family sugar kinase
VVSVADPVDRSTGRLVQLPDAPFMVGELDPPAVLADLVSSEVLVDNDVNWAARAERVVTDIDDPDNFVYLHLGEGLGCAVVCDGEVWRGHGGLAGEIAHIFTPGPHGDAVRFTEVFAQLGLRREGTTSIDVDKVLASFADLEDPRATLSTVSIAVASVLSAAIALADPATAVIGGAWGRDERFIAALQKVLSDSPRELRVARSRLDDQPELSGARAACLERLRDVIAGALSGG